MFEQLDAHDVEAYIDPDNTASIRLHKKLGFRFSSTLKGQQVFWLTSADFQKIRKRFQSQGTIAYLPRVKTKVVEELEWDTQNANANTLVHLFLTKLEDHFEKFPKLRALVVKEISDARSHEVLAAQVDRLEQLEAGSPDYLALESALSDAALYIHLRKNEILLDALSFVTPDPVLNLLDALSKSGVGTVGLAQQRSKLEELRKQFLDPQRNIVRTHRYRVETDRDPAP